MAKKTSTKKTKAEKAEEVKPKLNTIEFKEDVTIGNVVTINSKRYEVLKGKQLKEKTTGEVFDIV